MTSLSLSQDLSPVGPDSKADAVSATLHHLLDLSSFKEGPDVDHMKSQIEKCFAKSV